MDSLNKREQVKTDSSPRKLNDGDDDDDIDTAKGKHYIRSEEEK